MFCQYCGQEISAHEVSTDDGMFHAACTPTAHPFEAELLSGTRQPRSWISAVQDGCEAFAAFLDSIEFDLDELLPGAFDLDDAATVAA